MHILLPIVGYGRKKPINRRIPKSLRICFFLYINFQAFARSHLHNQSMETARIISSPVLRFQGAGADARTLKLPFRQLGNIRASFKTRDDAGILSYEFSDPGHMHYYQSRKQKGKTREMKKEEKKKMTLIKRLSKDLDFFSRTAYSEEFGSRLTGEVKGKIISEATEVLLAELEHLRSAQKGKKRERKEEKNRQKATLTKSKPMINSGSSSSPSSSSSSESSDGDGGVIVDMQRFTENKVEEVILAETNSETRDEHKQILSRTSNLSYENPGEDCCGRTGNECSSSKCKSSRTAAKIGICMGGKCKKLGAAELLQEFGKKIGREGSVVSCKCMGKCKYGPNVRVSNCLGGIQEGSLKSSVQTPINPLFIGVRMEDVGAIVANFLSQDSDRNDNSLFSAS